VLRVWLRCALATAVAVACVILLTGPPQPPPPLSEQDVRIYVEVMPQIQRALGEIADKFEVARLQSRGDAEALGMQAAAQVDALLACDPRVDLWNPNVVRASRGAVFSVPTVECDSASALAWLKRRGIRILASTPSADEVYSDIDLRQPVAVAVGTEDDGLSEFWISNADVKVRIPMLGKLNSLNVSVSAALIVYEALRQRNHQRD